MTVLGGIHEQSGGVGPNCADENDGGLLVALLWVLAFSGGFAYIE